MINIIELPYDILHTIISHLNNYITLSAFKQTCKHFNNVIITKQNTVNYPHIPYIVKIMSLLFEFNIPNYVIINNIIPTTDIHDEFYYICNKYGYKYDSLLTYINEPIMYQFRITKSYSKYNGLYIIIHEFYIYINDINTYSYTIYNIPETYERYEIYSDHKYYSQIGLVKFPINNLMKY